VSIDGETRGKTPTTLTLPPGTSSVEVTLALNGYEPVTRRVSATDSELSLALRPQGGKPGTTPGTKKPGQGGGNLGIKTGR
jgi:hypothetical protein